VNVATVGTLFANELGIFSNKELRQLCAGILLHDIGKTKISSDILNKKGKLTKEEFAKVKEHPDLGVQILKETGINLEEEFIITLQHHENDDGTGYPKGLRGEEIHVSGKIARIIDVYDALTTKRSYADAMSPFAALAEMKGNMLNCFDTEIFKEFINFLGPYDPRQKRRNNDKVFARKIIKPEFKYNRKTMKNNIHPVTNDKELHKIKEEESRESKAVADILDTNTRQKQKKPKKPKKKIKVKGGDKSCSKFLRQ
jgi:HD-GYP domain-containing protein (c-di-GMP phosphodiesterase class II)